MKQVIAIWSFILAFALTAVFVVSAQESARHRQDPIAQVKEWRLIYPSRISYLDGKAIEFITEAGTLVESGRLEIDADSQIPKGIKKGDKKLYWVLWCSTHNVVVMMSPYDPPKEEKKTNQENPQK